jgi:hypothetical protein
LGKDERTIRRWIAQRPELRAVLRARRHGKQWRIDYPESGFNQWLNSIRQAVAPFSQTPQRTSQYTKHICAGLGFGDAQRESDIEILRRALSLKRSLASPDDASLLDSLADWQRAADNCCATARMVTSHYQCRIEDAPRHWRQFLLLNRKERVQLQLFPLPTDAEIEAECEDLEELWPEPKHWRLAREQVQRIWLTQTLGEAAALLVASGQPVKGATLAPLLFRNHIAQDCWLMVQRHNILRSQGRDIFADGDAYRYGKRGISLRLFRHRYTKKDIDEAQRACGSNQPTFDPSNPQLDCDDTKGLPILNEKLNPIGSPTEKSRKNFEQAERTRRALKEAQPDLEKLTPDERLKIRRVLNS